MDAERVIKLDLLFNLGKLFYGQDNEWEFEEAFTEFVSRCIDVQYGMVRMDDGWEAYANGAHCGTYPNNQAAWSAARQAAFAPAMPTPTPTAPAAPAATVADAPLTPLTICAYIPSDHDNYSVAAYTTEDATESAVSFIEMDGSNALVCSTGGYGSESLQMPGLTRTQVRALRMALNHAAVTAWVGEDTVSMMVPHLFFQHGHIEGFWQRLKRSAPPAIPAIRVEACMCDDDNDVEGYGKPTGTLYRCDGIRAEFPLAPDSNIHNVPMLGIEGEPPIMLHDAYRCLPAINALLNSTEVQTAWSHWQEQLAERTARLAACPPIRDVFPESACNTIRNIFADYPDNPQAQAAALRRAAERIEA